MSIEPVTFADYSAMLSKATNEAVTGFAKMAGELLPALAKARDAFEAFGALVSFDTFGEIPDADYERLARRVAAAYNCTHPARKLSRRRLNRLQRDEVMRLWLREKR